MGLLTSRLSPILNSVKISAMNDIVMRLNGAGLTLGVEALDE